MHHTYKWVMQHIWMRRGTNINVSWHTYTWVMARIDGPYHSYEWVMPCISIIHATRESVMPYVCVCMCVFVCVCVCVCVCMCVCHTQTPACILIQISWYSLAHDTFVLKCAYLNVWMGKFLFQMAFFRCAWTIYWCACVQFRYSWWYVWFTHTCTYTYVYTDR